MNAQGQKLQLPQTHNKVIVHCNDSQATLMNKNTVVGKSPQQ